MKLKNPEQLGERLKGERKRFGITLVELQKLTNIDRRSLSKIEKGEQVWLRESTVEKLNEFFPGVFNIEGI